LSALAQTGDFGRFQQLFAALDGKVDALGVGGADLYIWVGDRRYTFRSIQRLVAVATKTPVVDGSGLKNTLEREALRWIQAHGVVDFARSTVLLVAAVDRFGMAQELAQLARRVIYGDLVFAVGLPIPIRSYRTVEILGRLLLPIITRLPFQWFYPTGEKQEKRTPRAERLFHEADVIAGDWHYIRRYMPDRIPDKTVHHKHRAQGGHRVPSGAGAAAGDYDHARDRRRELRHECDGRGHRRAYRTPPRNADPRRLPRRAVPTELVAQRD
jgi:hypothetical protein